MIPLLADMGIVTLRQALDAAQKTYFARSSTDIRTSHEATARSCRSRRPSPPVPPASTARRRRRTRRLRPPRREAGRRALPRAGWRGWCHDGAVAPQRRDDGAGAGAARRPLPPAAARWCWLGLGSEGRLEQTLSTDQDNALVFSASDDGEARELRELFLPFARAANQAWPNAAFRCATARSWPAIRAGACPRRVAGALRRLGAHAGTRGTAQRRDLFRFPPLAGDAGLAPRCGAR
jgi:hypothetical protein